MKRQVRFLALAISALMAGCSLLPAGGNGAPQAAHSAASGMDPAKNVNAVAPSIDRVVVDDGTGRVEVEKVGFRSGVSSASVERLAKRHGCNGSVGAGLLTVKGPVEVYRMQCDSGAVFMARCELRQCRPMH